jgi:putative signal transducing protein
MPQPSSRVRIGSCAGAAEAALVRCMFDAHDIPALIGGERHAQMLGTFGAGVISADIYVHSDDVEDASALLAELRGASTTGSAATAVDVDEPDAADPAFEHAMTRRKRSGIVVLLALCVSFGTAHLYTRAWLRGMVLAGIEIIGILRIHQPLIGRPLIIGAIAFDLIGALWRVRQVPLAAPLPIARVVR